MIYLILSNPPRAKPPPSFILTPVRAESSQHPSRTEPPPSEPSNNKRAHPLPLDEYLCFESSSSDEEMEEIAPGGPSTTTTTSTPSPQSERVRCLWKGCCTEFEAGTHNDVLKNHIRSAHMERGNGGGSRRPQGTKCQWDGCDKNLRQHQSLMEHMEKHFRTPCPLGCGRSFQAECFITRHLRSCPERTGGTRG